MRFSLVPSVRVHGTFLREFFFLVRIADLDAGTLAEYAHPDPVLSIAAGAGRTEQARAFGEFLDACAAHQRSANAPALTVVTT